MKKILLSSPRFALPALKLAIICAVVQSSDVAGGADTISVDEVRPGMKGYGLTVFVGTEPERFDVEVVSVVPNFLLRQSIILIRCSHPVIEKAGIIGGMSGSPIYLEGRLAGALAYGWTFNKEPVAGVTPIANMLDVLKRKERNDNSSTLGRVLNQTGMIGRATRAQTTEDGKRYFDLFVDNDPNQPTPARTPLALSGFSTSAGKLLANALVGFGIDPVTGGGGKEEGGPKELKAGSTIGIQLIRGDMNATGMGTVTTVMGKQVLALGHPMFNLGQGYFPVTTGKIHAIISSIARSNKVGSPLNVVGATVQDRMAGIVARTDRQAEMIPVSIAIEDKRSKRLEKYKVEIAAQRLLTPSLLQASLVNVIMDAASDMTDVTAEIFADLKIRGRSKISLKDSGIARQGLVGLIGFFRPIQAISDVLSNPFEDSSIESVDFKINLNYGLDFALIKGAYVTAEKPLPGEIVNLNIELAKYGAVEEIMAVPIKIPKAAAGEKIEITVGGGDFISPVMPTPQTLDDILKNYSRFYPTKSIVINIYIHGSGIAIKGRVLENLPASAVDALLPASGSGQASTHKAELIQIVETPFVVAGKETIRMEIGGIINK